jgi:hypothetical protein
VWDLPGDREARALEEPAARLRARLDEELAVDRRSPPTSAAPAPA